ncbi:unnamed protein product [Prorocentrum cordatum]|uniref:RNA-editing substrate-binding complex 6 protein domain-containing protein n=1 Tax=Prorocentrum cordatum TaxID=2364126 RepID=A0ABN9WHZ1_9DINO|nr:unnamed protein product [Polarella glacialis]
MAWLNSEVTRAAGWGAEALLELVERRAPDFNVINAATALSRLARLFEGADNGRREELFELPAFRALLRRTVELVEPPPVSAHHEARSVATAAHALAKLGCRDRGAADALVAAAHARVVGLDRQGVANLAWALVRLPLVAGPEGSRALAARLARCARGPSAADFLPQEVSSLLWALARFGVQDSKLMSAMSDRVLSGSADFTPQGLATVAAAYARLGVFMEPLLDEIGRAAWWQLDKLNGRDVAQIIWSFAKFKKMEEPMFEALCAHAAELDLSREGKDLVVNLLWSFGTLQWVPPQGCSLLEKLLLRARELAPQLRARRAVRLLTALAKLHGHAALGARARAALAGVAELLSEGSRQLVEDTGPQEVGTSAWALATLRPRGWGAAAKALFSRARVVSEDLNWFSVAHLDYAMRLAGGRRSFMTSRRAPRWGRCWGRC